MLKNRFGILSILLPTKQNPPNLCQFHLRLFNLAKGKIFIFLRRLSEKYLDNHPGFVYIRLSFSNNMFNFNLVY